MPFRVTVAPSAEKSMLPEVGVWVSVFGVRSIAKREPEEEGGGRLLYSRGVPPYTGVT